MLLLIASSFRLRTTDIANVMGKNIYGLMAEFDTPTQLVEAARKVRDAGYKKTDAFFQAVKMEIIR